MNSFEEIINKEKAVSYKQRDKELFSFYTLTLIAQEQASRKIRRQLLIFAVLLTACLLMLLSPINQITGNLSAYLSAMDIVDIFKMALVTYGFLGLLFVMFKSRVSLFR